MPVKGIERVKRGFRIAVKEIGEGKTERAVYETLSQGSAMAAQMTPIDASNLVNSQYAPQIEVKEGKVSGSVGYTASYAAAVHEASGKLNGKPRADFGRTRAGVGFGGGTGNGNYWDPNAEPEFLTKGFDQIKGAVPAILKRIYGV
ncbi:MULTISPECIES: hypothetical protein [Achromobacter]|uniref:HK97 gp10 family phage protein n=1 Tax=Achromobacter spanius TaxID=217203 RepID=A0ABY8GSH4_9BURK|nr:MULTISPECIES: hypothetical protein [Achromobacter]WAI83196.1 hypothetical protein N8Z00_27500 [Achromobacter spanius]WEX93281.1 hypothetical protein N3Z32_22095 [Achromobacter sp. SS2-2022]WFP07561.1 hypothetical protein P8T11_25155 [Achromobacter spanius]